MPPNQLIRRTTWLCALYALCVLLSTVLFALGVSCTAGGVMLNGLFQVFTPLFSVIVLAVAMAIRSGEGDESRPLRVALLAVLATTVASCVISYPMMMHV